MNLPSLRSRRLAAALALVSVAVLSCCTRPATHGYEGYVEGKYVYVASPQGGRLEELSVARGDLINASHPLFTLDGEPEASALRQA